MRAFEITINGEKKFVAGLENPHVLTAILTSHVADPESADEGPPDSLDLMVGGLSPKTDQNSEWPQHAIAIGDVITIRVIETDQCDPPQDVSTGPR